MDSKSTKVSSQQLAAKKYIEENEIERIVSEMLNSLVHEKAKQPVVYMIKYLAGLLSEEERKQSGLVIPEPYPKGKLVPVFPEFKSLNNNSLSRKYLTKSVWSQIKHNRSKHDATINVLTKLSENPSNDPVGCVLSDSSCLSNFSPFIGPIMVELHKYTPPLSEAVSETEKFRPPRLASFFNVQATNDNFPFYERVSDKVCNLKFSFSRNLSNTAFPVHISKEKRSWVESTILKAINQMIDDRNLPEGKFLNFKDNEFEIQSLVKEYEIDLNLLQMAGMSGDWPLNRLVFITKDSSLIIFINFIDHFKLIVNPRQIESSDNQYTRLYNESLNLLKSFEKYLQFDYDKYFGYITSLPILIGAGMEITCRIKLENLTKVNQFSNKLSTMDYDYMKIDGSDVVLKKYCKLSNDSDLEFCEEFYYKLSGLINLDRSDEFSEWVNMPILQLSELQRPAILKTYESQFENLKNCLSISGRSINSLVRPYHKNPNIYPAIFFYENFEYKTFRKFVRDYIFHSQNFDFDLHDHIYKPDEIKNSDSLKIQEHGGKLISTTISLIRNIHGYPFACSKNNKNSEVVEQVSRAVEKIKIKGINSNIVHLNTEEFEKLKNQYSINFINSNSLKDLGIQEDFPNNTLIFQFDKDDIFAIVNDIDHLKIKIYITDDKLQAQFIKLLKISNEFSKSLNFIYDKHLGFLTASPDLLGSGMVTKSKLKLKNLIIKQEYLEQLLTKYGFSYKIMDKEEAIIEVQNKFTVGRSEIDILTSLICLINNLIQEDNASDL